jgi:hypothetical protein
VIEFESHSKSTWEEDEDHYNDKQIQKHLFFSRSPNRLYTNKNVHKTLVQVGDGKVAHGD